jgi:hypothetical protein
VSLDQESARPVVADANGFRQRGPFLPREAIVDPAAQLTEIDGDCVEGRRATRLAVNREEKEIRRPRSPARGQRRPPG